MFKKSSHSTTVLLELKNKIETLSVFIEFKQTRIILLNEHIFTHKKRISVTLRSGQKNFFFQCYVRNTQI